MPELQLYRIAGFRVSVKSNSTHLDLLSDLYTIPPRQTTAGDSVGTLRVSARRIIEATTKETPGSRSRKAIRLHEFSAKLLVGGSFSLNRRRFDVCTLASCAIKLPQE
jgi:hypothetical protein